MLTACASPSPKVLTPAVVRESPENYVVIAVRNPVGTYRRAGSTTRSYSNDASYIESAAARKVLRSIATDYELQAVSGWPIPSLALQCVVFKTNNAGTRDELLTKLKQDARISLAQPLQSFDTNSLPSDAVQSSDSSYNDPYAKLQSNLSRMGIQAAHHWSRGTGVQVAVIDTGVDSLHPDLQGRIGEQRNFVDNDAAQFRNDRHGTAVAGVLAANANNGIGIVGIAPEATLFALKACWQLRPDHDAARCNTFTLAQALESAIELHAQVINLSVVGPLDPLLVALVARAQASGIIVVGALSPQQAFPAQLANVVAVAAMEDATGALPTSQDALLAPGRDVMTLLPRGRYDFSSGNSIATAEVSGTIALLLASKGLTSAPKIDGLFLRQLLSKATAIDADDRLSAVNACLALSQLTKRNRCAEALLQLARQPTAAVTTHSP